MRFWKKQNSESQPKELTDTELVRMAKEDKAAFGEIYERYLDKIYRYVYYRVGTQQDAEDLTSRVFYRAFTHVDGYEDRGVPFQAWLYRIAHNLVANHHRDRSRRKIIPLDEYVVTKLFADTDGPERAAENTEERERLLRVVRQLPQDRQQLLILKFVDQLSNAEIGDIMDRTEGAIKSLYHRTLTALRDELIPDTNPDTARKAK